MDQSDLRWFRQQLDFYREDRDLEDGGYVLDFYWDTFDVREALLGVAAYYTPAKEFEAKRFGSDEALVHCLLAAECLGTIQLLQPHQAEFLRLLKSEFGLDSEEFPGGMDAFVRQSGLTTRDGFQLNSISKMKTKEIATLVDEQKGNAQTLFKVVHCVKRPVW